VPTFQTIVAAVDFSKTSHEAFRVAADMAGEAKGSLHLVHVVPAPIYESWSVQAPDLESAGVHAQWVEDARTELLALAATLRLDPTRVTCTAVPGQPAVEIVRYASEHGADLVVLGTHGYGPVNRLLLGSVADRVVRQAPCPVLVVPPASEHEVLGLRSTSAA